MLQPHTCQRARRSRDARFDGQFFTAVLTTGIYCRSICPAPSPKEENVRYYPSAAQAAQAGFRPCLRCRPDCAPNSAVWNGVDTTLSRAIALIHRGDLQDQNLPEFAERLGVGDRYLRQLFQKHLGLSPKTYALYQQCLFAKQLLHQTQLPIHQVAVASGFNSVRRFNDCFQKNLKLTPTQVRRQTNPASETIQLDLSYRPPYNWDQVQPFLAARTIEGLDACDANSYRRTFQHDGVTGSFHAIHQPTKNRFQVSIELDDLQALRPTIQRIRRLLDLDVDSEAVFATLRECLPEPFPLKQGLRIPGQWTMFEAGVRAVLGQQVTVVAAKKLVRTLIETLGETQGSQRFFPTPRAVAAADLSFLKMPQSRKNTLATLAHHYLTHPEPDQPEAWLALKGIGPWTVNYAKLRGRGDPDVFLGGDLGVKKVVQQHTPDLDPNRAAPWRSYLTMQLWSMY
ncbi:AlkA N-terminal domain-containing protein [Acanthopleuribacter pedis]|uniref:DNA-3-methyladenine glycosylase II n=1 Tax=Acanthopleuribacter pedis TaxID=442870 RepID=A0A8J7QG63_9BACT|nr:AlkA N-terminal domain-containing protein [Acanthopleuribacter pedis]MBO1321690.1 DNA-3-methyladenine glycosylase 2 family protein [Acanthopleuribacter pedis]